MYQPEHFLVDDLPQMHALMRGRPFAALVSAGAYGLYATHMPTVLKDDGQFGLVEFHLARANPHSKYLAECTEALLIFQGPEAYITPNWYPSKAEHQKVVPTWNYAIVHAYGRPEAMQDPHWLRRHVGELTAQQERTEARPWEVTDAPASFIDGMVRGIVGFRPEPRDHRARYGGDEQHQENAERVAPVLDHAVTHAPAGLGLTLVGRITHGGVLVLIWPEEGWLGS